VPKLFPFQVMGILKHYGQKWAGLEMFDKLVFT